MQALLDRFPPQQPKLRIRIAGTNGKGSTASMLASALQAADLRVGLYTSPHIHAFNERIRIDGVPITDAALQELLQEMVPQAIEIGASYFEVATCLALYQFARERVDAEVLEAGVGARLDATTAVDADMALITPIGLDHQAWLGSNLAAIAGEKAYAVDGCRWAISAPQHEVVSGVLLQHRPDIQFAAPAAYLPTLRMQGAHQRSNAALAYRAIECLCDADIISGDPAHAIAATELPGRLQHLEWDRHQIWLDAAHNMHAVEAILPALSELAPFDAILVFTREDRDLSEAVPLLSPLTERLVMGGGSGAMSEPFEQVLEREIADRPKGRFLIIGSFLTMEAANRWIAARR